MSGGDARSYGINLRKASNGNSFAEAIDRMIGHFDRDLPRFFQGSVQHLLNRAE